MLAIATEYYGADAALSLWKTLDVFEMKALMRRSHELRTQRDGASAGAKQANKKELVEKIKEQNLEFESPVGGVIKMDQFFFD